MKNLRCLAIVLFVLVASLPARAQSDEESALENLTVAQLCEMNGGVDAVRELRRRELFSFAELRAIRKQRARNGISLEALVCAMGAPDRIATGLYGDEYFYAREGQKSVVVLVRHREGGSFVLRQGRPPTSSLTYMSAQSGFPFPVITANSNFGGSYPIVVNEELGIQQPEWDNLPW